MRLTSRKEAIVIDDARLDDLRKKLKEQAEEFISEVYLKGLKELIDSSASKPLVAVLLGTTIEASISGGVHRIEFKRGKIPGSRLVLMPYDDWMSEGEHVIRLDGSDFCIAEIRCQEGEAEMFIDHGLYLDASNLKEAFASIA